MTQSEQSEHPLHVIPSEWSICVLPPGDINYSVFEIKVCWRGNTPDGPSYAVIRSRYRLNSDGDWDFELSPSGRNDDWIRDHSFTLERALELAKEWAPKVVVNGKTALEIEPKQWSER